MCRSNKKRKFDSWHVQRRSVSGRDWWRRLQRREGRTSKTGYWDSHMRFDFNVQTQTGKEKTHSRGTPVPNRTKTEIRIKGLTTDRVVCEFYKRFTYWSTRIRVSLTTKFFFKKKLLKPPLVSKSSYSWIWTKIVPRVTALRISFSVK